MLIKKVLGLTNWQAVHYLEELAEQDTSNDEQEQPCEKVDSIIPEEKPPVSPPPTTLNPVTSQPSPVLLNPGRIPEYELERIKREINLVELVQASGVKLKRVGKDFIGLCPFHNDTNPSLVVSPDSNLWNCLGACNKGGSNIDWVMCENECGLSCRQ